MKRELIILLTPAFWMLTMTVGHGQIRPRPAAEAGSAEAIWREYEWKEQLEEMRKAARAKAEKERIERDKRLDSGRRLFGVDQRWTFGTGGELVGTLATKGPSDFAIGDWGCASVVFQTVNKISSTEVLVSPVNADAEVMLIRGFDMSNVTDGIEFILQHPVFIQETYSYTTLSGNQKTVFVLERNEDKLAEILVKIRAAAERKREAERAAAEAHRKAAEDIQRRMEEAKWRTWTSGKYTVKAEFVSAGGGIVRLKRLDNGIEIRVPMRLLSKEDQRFVRNREWLNYSSSDTEDAATPR